MWCLFEVRTLVIGGLHYSEVIMLHKGVMRYPLHYLLCQHCCASRDCMKTVVEVDDDDDDNMNFPAIWCISKILS